MREGGSGAGALREDIPSVLSQGIGRLRQDTHFLTYRSTGDNIWTVPQPWRVASLRANGCTEAPLAL